MFDIASIIYFLKPVGCPRRYDLKLKHPYVLSHLVFFNFNMLGSF